VTLITQRCTVKCGGKSIQRFSFLQFSHCGNKEIGKFFFPNINSEKNAKKLENFSKLQKPQNRENRKKSILIPDRCGLTTFHTMSHKDVIFTVEKALQGLLITNATVHITSLQCMLHMQPILLLTLELSTYMLQILLWGFLYSVCYISNQCRGEFSLQCSNITRRGFCREICAKRDVTCTVENFFECPAGHLV
jgi:hypothetical protein